MKLNKNQIDFMLDTFFESDYQIYKCFDTCDRDWLKAQKIELEPDNYGWHKVIMNDEEYTSINTKVYKQEFAVMMKIK